MPKFMLIVHQPPGATLELSPEEAQAYASWRDGIVSSGRYVVSDKLMEEGGKVVALENGHAIVSDGPFSETKEIVGGYMTIRAADYDEAVSIVSDCPMLRAGRIAIRQTDPMGCGDE